MSFLKLYDGLIVKTAEIDPEKKFPYDDASAYDAQLVKEISDLEGIVAKFSSGDVDDGSQVIVIDGNYPESVKVELNEYNKRIGHTGAVKELTEKNELLIALRGEDV